MSTTQTQNEMNTDKKKSNFLLDALFGNKTAGSVLLFLLVNRRSFGCQMQQHLPLSLTPIQRTLARLEDAEIVSSYYEGRTRYFELNHAHPLSDEIEALLKKAYSLLSSKEKPRYTIRRQDLGKSKSFPSKLLYLEKRLLNVSESIYEVLGTKMTGKGRGIVEVERKGEKITLIESGEWHTDQGTTFDFTNRFRFTFDYTRNMASLEHLRQGSEHPIFLCHLEQTAPSSFESFSSHLCGSDSYICRIDLTRSAVKIHWRIIGPEKNDRITHTYYHSNA